MKSNKSTFNSASLRVAFEKNKAKLDSFKDNLDRISEDIKMLEDYLSASELNVPITLSLGEWMQSEELAGRGFIGPEYDGCPVQIEREELLWDKDETSRFRLLYVRALHDGYLDLDGGGDKPYRVNAVPLQYEKKPLIETKLDVRIRMNNVLPQFIEAIGERLGDLAAVQANAGERLAGLEQILKAAALKSSN